MAEVDIGVDPILLLSEIIIFEEDGPAPSDITMDVELLLVVLWLIGCCAGRMGIDIL
jgi:hypothetical protein